MKRTAYPQPRRGRERATLACALALFASVVARPVEGSSDSDDSDQSSSDNDLDERPVRKTKHDEDQDKEKEKNKDKKDKDKIEDTAIKRASLEFAGYNDSDHVSVLTPSVALGIENVSGASLHANYLVDVVSAASVDIVSTASRRWEEVRHVGSLDAAYKPGTFGVAANAGVSSEPDYLSWVAGGSITQDFFAKNL
ncbi:MAG TPA: hypothetical protein VKU41_06915, partial [Polyangiaceae bacterium]|nr:hypothetical protein [Polyangiaceae bacterium]